MIHDPDLQQKPMRKTNVNHPRMKQHARPRIKVKDVKFPRNLWSRTGND